MGKAQNRIVATSELPILKSEHSPKCHTFDILEINKTTTNIHLTLSRDMSNLRYVDSCEEKGRCYYRASFLLRLPLILLLAMLHGPF